MGAAAPGTHARVVKAAAQLVQQRDRVLVHHVQFCQSPWSFFPTQREHGIKKSNRVKVLKIKSLSVLFVLLMTVYKNLGPSFCGEN